MRTAIRGLLVRNLQSRLMTQAFRVTGAFGYDVDSTASDLDQPRLQP
jgi:hypothetical protein